MKQLTDFIKFRPGAGYTSLFFWIFLFLAVRLSLLWAFSEDLFWYEDLYPGTIAKELLNGSGIPLWNWQKFPHEGGTLWVGLMAVPFFKLFGPSYFALKLAPITSELIALILAYGFLFRHFSGRSANIAACLMIFGAPAYIKLRMLAVGTHTSADFLWLGALWSFYESMASKPKSPASRLFPALAGFFCGLGLGYAYIVGISVAALIASWLFWNPRSLVSGKILCFLGGFLTGYSPTLVYNATHDWATTDWMLGWLASNSPSGPAITLYLKKLIVAISRGFVLSFSFGDIPGVSWLFWTISYGMMITSAYVLGCLNDKNSKKKLLFRIYPVIFIVTFTLIDGYSAVLTSAFFSYRYYAPLQLMLLIGAAIGLADISKDFLRRTWIGFILFLAAIGIVSMTGSRERKNPASMPGYSYYLLGSAWAVYQAPFPQKYAEFIRLLQNIDPKATPQIYEGYFDWDNISFFHEKFSHRRIKYLLKKIKEETSLRKIHLLKLLGHYVFHHKGLDTKLFDSITQILPENERGYFYAGAFRNTVLLNISDIAWHELAKQPPAAGWLAFQLGYDFYGKPEWAKLESQLNPSLRRWAYRGAGRICGEKSHSSGAAFGAECTVPPPGITEQLGGDFFWGLGWEAASYFPSADTLSRFEDFLKSRDVKKKSIQKALEGFESYRRWQNGLIPHPL